MFDTGTAEHMRGGDVGVQLLSIVLGELSLAFDVANVQEVVKYQEVTTIPLSAHEVSGLINLRGQILTAIDVRCLLGVSGASRVAEPVNVVIEVGDELYSFLVDDIGDVVESTESSRQLPSSVGPVLHRVSRGMYQLDRGVVIVLDPARLIEEILTQNER